MIPGEYLKNIYRGALVFLGVISLFFAVKFLEEVKTYSMMDGSENSVITLSGHGEVKAVPDIANIYFTIRKDGKTVKEAQDAVVVVEKKALDFLSKSGVEDKDIQTTNASFNPKYQNNITPCPLIGTTSGSAYPCRNTTQTIIGYEAYENITVKLRNPDDSGKVMGGLGELGVEQLNGPNFSIDDEDALKAMARKDAIDDARSKAEVLARDLGVRLGKITSFNENGSYPGPMYYDKVMTMSAEAGSAPSAAQVPKGENTITSDVTISYEIK